MPESARPGVPEHKKLKRFFAELKRRGMLKVATAYLVVSWLTLEIGHTLFLIFELPHGGLQFVFVLLAVGFPIALLGTWQGWFGAVSAQTQEPEHGARSKHEGGPHEGPWLAVIFGTVALFAVAVAIGVRFYGMGRGASSHGSHAATNASAPTPSEEGSPTAAGTFAPPPGSIAVLPFVNMSGDPQQEYFSDGLSEELLNALTRIKQLQVAARTSSFSFKGEKSDIEEIARRLNVGAVLEGSVRKAGNRVRITAQLVNAVTGFHSWSQTYERDLEDVFAVQTEIATMVTTALQATLLGDVGATVDLGGTQSALALDAYLRGLKLRGTSGKEALLAEIAAYTEAIQLDDRYAKAYVAKARALNSLAGGYVSDSALRETFEQGRAAAETALELAPELGEAHAAFAAILDHGFADYASAEAEYGRALALAPGDATVLRSAASFLSSRGRAQDSVTHAQRAVTLDPLNHASHRTLALVLYDARRYGEAISVFDRASSLNPRSPQMPAFKGLSHMWLGDNEAARKSCERPPLDWMSHVCLAVVYHKLQRKPQAEAALAVLMDENGDSAAMQYAEIYAQWRDTPKALKWIETAYRLRDPGLVYLRVDRMLDPLRQEPRFQEIERKLYASN
jgi:TolB-like protein/tetratricopeptide (TPR) repeat protein